MLHEIAPQPRRVYFYVDGFNLYHRRLEPQPHLKWLSLRTLAQEHLFKGSEVAVVKFFTAQVDSHIPAERPTPKQIRQMTYWRALKSTEVEIVTGLLERRERQCKSDACGLYARYRYTSEKMSDVNLALHIYRDYVENLPDVVCVVSGDCDVLPALRMVREHAHRINRTVMIVICLPSPDDGLLFTRLPRHYQLARTVKLGESQLRMSQFPDQLALSDGPCLRPDTWR